MYVIELRAREVQDLAVLVLRNGNLAPHHPMAKRMLGEAHYALQSIAEKRRLEGELHWGRAGLAERAALAAVREGEDLAVRVADAIGV
jgi:hypothetical protein